MAEPIYANISTQFSGIGHVVIHTPSIISTIRCKFNLKDNIPLHTYVHGIEFYVANLKASGLADITFSLHYNSTADVGVSKIEAVGIGSVVDDDLFTKTFSNVVTEYIRAKYEYTCDINDFLKHKRVALVLCDDNTFRRRCLERSLYCATFMDMEFVYPFTYAFVYKPLDHKLSNKFASQDDFVYELKDEMVDMVLPEYSRVREIFCNPDLVFVEDGSISCMYEKDEFLRICNALISKLRKEGDVFFDGRILKGLYRIANIDDYKADVMNAHKQMRNLCDFETNGVEYSNGTRGSGFKLNSSMVMESVSADQLSLLLTVKNLNAQPAKRHLQNLRKSALSLFGGKLLYAPIVRHKSKAPKLSTKQRQIIEQNEMRMQVEKKAKDNAWLRNFFIKYKNMDTKAKKSLLESVAIDNDQIHQKVLLLKIEYYSDLWNLEKRSTECDMRTIIPCYVSCLEYLEKYLQSKIEDSREARKLQSQSKSNAEGKDIALERGDITPVDDAELAFVFQKLIDCGFEATVHEILESNKIALELSFYTKDTSAPSDYDICFQLKYSGDKLKRSLNSRKDPRVLFKPDEWQVRLLDLVDEGSTAIISAPTSAGKTFICFYAIEKVLRQSDTDVVIFCLPTKALVNQVTADIYARFTPKVKATTVLQGSLMKDFVTEPFNCQVLITLPSLLESLLNTPPKKIVERLKYIIIDEVHLINSEEMGVPIERIIHLSPCPLLVLSATLGNLDGFYAWVKNIEQKKGRKCELVIHKERYCELKSYVYHKDEATMESDNANSSHAHKSENKQVSQTNVIQGNGKENILVTGALSTKSTITPINNLFAYSYQHIKKFGFGNDLSFLPEELLYLYDSICAVLKENQLHLVHDLIPENFFKSNILTKKDVKSFEIHLLSKFEDWVSSNVLSEKQVKKVYTLQTRAAKLAFEHVVDYSEEYLLNNMLDLLVNLKARNMLPCIVFNTDRDFVSKLALRVYETLEAMDKEKKRNKYMEKVKKEVKRSRDQEKSKDSWIEDSIALEQNCDMKSDRKNIQYCFLDPVTKLTDYELEEECRELRNTDHKFVDMLYRGIGVHHAHMNRKYRILTEVLFRQKHLQVLFATETLALGINMPCRTVVFAGDSLKLDPMNYRQMAGRAGRRGFDTLGNIVFMGIPKPRVQNLMVSLLPNIKGGYTYTNTSFIGFDIKESLLDSPLFEICKTNATDNNKVISIMSDQVANNSHSQVASYNSLENRISVDDVAFDNAKDKNTKDDVNKKLSMLSIEEQLRNGEDTVFDVGKMRSKGLCAARDYDLSYLFEAKLNRTKLVNYQLSLLGSLFDNTNLSDLVISNRDMDPAIFVFSMLLQTNLVDFEPRAFMLLLAHFFEIRPVLNITLSLPKLTDSLQEFVCCINDRYMNSMLTIYTPRLRNLQLQSASPLHKLQSFLYLDTKYKNSYLLDFFIHGSLSRVISENGVPSGELFKSLNSIDTVMRSLIRMYDMYGLDGEKKKQLVHFYSMFEPKFKAIFA